MEYIVYKHTNLHNGKVYIGITKQKPERRWDNGRGYVGNKHFYSAIQKYGWHNFNHRVLYDGLTKEQANAIEIALIAAYDSANPQFGYNIELGGNGKSRITDQTREKQRKSHKGATPWNLGIPHSEETKQKIKEALTGGKLSEETRKKMSKSKMGIGNSFYGKHHSTETIKKNAENQPTRRMVVCLETKQVFPSMAEAARQTGVKQGNISLVCAGKHKTAGGLTWAYYEGDLL